MRSSCLKTKTKTKQQLKKHSTTLAEVGDRAFGPAQAISSFLAVLGFGLRVSALLGRHSAT
jgi:hypothetical protein